MIAVINEKETTVERKYPCLKEYKVNSLHQIVLFNEPRTGTLVFQDSGKEQTGYHSIYWPEELFTPFTGSITLSND